MTSEQLGDVDNHQLVSYTQRWIRQATAVIDTDITDDYELTAIANNTVFTVTGTPTDGQMLMIRLKDAGTTKTLTWTMSGGVIGVTLPTTTTTSKWHIIGFKYFTSTTSWKAIAVGEEA